MHITELLTTMQDALIDWLVHGLSNFSGWQIVAYTLVTTHITIAAVTIVLHLSQAHRSVKLHALPSHFFRFWLWLSTGIVTREWVAVHRKHHAACETPEDPHSQQTRGIVAVLLRGSELYAAAAKDRHMLDQYGAGTPYDWIERKLYTPRSFYGVGLMLAIDLLAFGAIGATVWAVQMLWIPVSAAGIVNGIGHWWGYRNFEVADASRNIVPWGILIGGEEPHNNHHTYPTSAKLSVRRHEFDLGWADIRGLEMLGLATVRRVPPQLRLGSARPVADARAGARGRRACKPAQRAPLAAPRRGTYPEWRARAGIERGRTKPGACRTGRDARTIAPTVDALGRVRRTTCGRPEGLAEDGRGKQYLDAARVRGDAALGPRVRCREPLKARLGQM